MKRLFSGGRNQEPFFDHCHKVKVLENISSIYKSKELVDFNIVIDEKNIFAHKIALSASSSFFRGLFLCKTEENVQMINFTGLTSYESMKAIVDYFYTSLIHVNETNVEEILFLATFFVIDSLIEYCNNYAEKILSKFNCFYLRKVAEKCCSPHLFEKCSQVIYKEFLNLVNTTEFLKLPLDEVHSILSTDNVNVVNEDDILNSLYLWVEYDPPNRLKDLNTLIKAVRLKSTSILSLDRFKNAITTLANQFIDPTEVDIQPVIEIITKEILFLSLFVSGLNYFQIEIPQHRISPRNSLETRKTIVTVGGYDGCNCLNLVSALSGTVKEWIFLASMNISRNEHSIVSDHTNVYALGGFSENKGPLKEVEIYHPFINKWIETPSMRLHRKGLASAFLNDYLYSSGGVDQSYKILCSVERYRKTMENWEFVTSMIIPRTSHCLVSDGRYLYALGGVGLQSAEKFCPSEERWELIEDIPTVRCGASAVYYKNKIYVFCGMDEQNYHKSVEVYDIHNKSWHTYPNAVKLARVRAGITIFNDRIFICGGKDFSWSYTGCVESFDPNFLTSQLEPSMPLPAVGSQCCSLDLPTNHLNPH